MSVETIGRYRVEKTLGQGGMGKVVLARDPVLGRVVAVKTLLDAGEKAPVLRFVEEAQITGQLDHPNIVPVHELGWHDYAPFLAMRFVAGKDMKHLVERLAEGEAVATRDYGLRRRLRLFLKVCVAVGHAHERGVIHRDLKPANVMLGPDDEVLVMDWGLARPLDAGPEEPRRPAVVSAARSQSGAGLTQAGAFVGTPHYMAPEQADAAVLDRTADVYSLGTLLYELLALKTPYSGSSIEVLTALVQGPPPSLAVVAPWVPPAVRSIVEKAMGRRPADRYADAAALGEDVEAFLDERPVSCHRETAREALARLASRHRIALLALVVAVVSLAAIGAVAMSVIGSQRAVAAREAEVAKAAAATAERELKSAADASRRAADAAAAEAIASRVRRDARDFTNLALTPAPTKGLRVRRDELVPAIEGRARDLPRTEATAPALARARAAREAVDLALVRALVDRRPRVALATLDEATTIAPGPEAPLLRARALVRVERGQDAVGVLDRATWPQDRPDLALGAKALRLVALDAPSRETRAAVDQALAAVPGTPWLLALRADLEAREGDFDAARRDFDRAFVLDPADTWAVGQRYTIFFTPNVHEECLPSATLYHTNVMLGERAEAPFWVHHQDLIHLWHMGNHTLHTGGIDGSVKFGTTSALEGARRKAEGLLLMQQWALAEKAARQAVELVPGDREGTAFLAQALVGLGRYDAAIAVADPVLEKHPTDGPLALGRGEAALLLGRPAEAEPFLEIAARRSRLPDPWERFARCLSLLDDPAKWEKGVEAMRQGLRFDVFDSWLASHAARPLTGDPLFERTLGDLRRRQGYLGAAALHYARAARAPARVPRERVGQWYGTDRQDFFRLAEVVSELELPQLARVYFEKAREDPKLKAEAERRLAALR